MAPDLPEADSLHHTKMPCQHSVTIGDVLGDPAQVGMFDPLGPDEVGVSQRLECTTPETEIENLARAGWV